MCLLLTLFVSLVSMTSQVAADLTVKISPNVMYWGETSEVIVRPYNRKYSVIANFDPDRYGFTLVNKKYIKSMRQKTYDGRIRIEAGPSIRYRSLKILSPYFVATLPDGQEQVEKKPVYSFRKDAELGLGLVCNAQKPIKWDVENKSVVSLDVLDKNACRLYGVQEGRTTITATYMGYKYSVEIRVLPPKNLVERARDEFEHIATDITVWLRSLTRK